MQAYFADVMNTTVEIKEAMHYQCDVTFSQHNNLNSSFLHIQVYVLYMFHKRNEF